MFDDHFEYNKKTGASTFILASGTTCGKFLKFVNNAGERVKCMTELFNEPNKIKSKDKKSDKSIKTYTPLLTYQHAGIIFHLILYINIYIYICIYLF